MASSSCAVASVMVAAIASMIFGISLGFTSPAIDVMQDTVRENGHWIPAPAHLVVFESDHKSSSQGSLFSAIVNIGALLGALCGGPLSQRVGRKGSILLMAPLFVLVWALTSVASSFTPLLLARFFLGVGIGLCSTVVPTYINEISPTHLRGALGAVFQMACVVGIMLTYLLGAYVFVESGHGHVFCQWRLLSLFPLALAVLLFLLGLMIPESPRWLASIGRADAARLALARLRGGAQFIGEELEEIHAAVSEAGGAGGWKDLLYYRKAVAIGLMLMFLQQFSGVNAVIFFQNTIFMQAGMANPAAMGFYVMLLQVIMTGISIPLMDTAGRKMLLIVAASGMIACCIGMVIFFLHDTPAWLADLSSFGYIAFFSLGIGPIPWLMMGEIFPGKIRSSASSLAAGFNWTLSFITTETVGGLQAAISFSGVFGLYGCCLVIGLLYVIKSVPETKGKSFAEIEDIVSPKRDIPLISA
ncbi:unnamed protein product [Effrenium voratum]|nr:unnamed protein product [Effrenium voratum]|mmetsp:Transcript_101715/g.242572  ORF Transcript_101715/g.242572 Transcript_101715/m.242572 type:complete len:473 (+) Transcript_101715:94-1512(+)